MSDPRQSFYEHEMQADWFIREVQRCREIGMPLGCCDCWPECSHVLAWVESNPLPAAANSHSEPRQ